MEFGIFALMQQRHPTKPPSQIFREAIEQTELADQLGFAAAWYPEHHFSNYSLCPSPLMLAAHAAARTRRIRLGAGVVVAPLYEPARLVSEIALVDTLSQGRLNVGIGPGYQHFEFERFGVALEDARASTEEMIDIIELALSGKPFAYAGAHHRMPRSMLSLRPVQQPMPPLWIASGDERLIRRAVRDGHYLFTTAFLGNWKRISGIRERVDQICLDEGRDPRDAKVAIQRFAFASDDPREVEHYVDCARYQQRLGVSLKRRQESVDDGYMVAEQPFEDELPFEKMMQNLPVGDVDTVIERMVREIRVLRPRHYAIQTQPGDMEHRVMMRQIEILGTEIIPAIRRELAPAPDARAARAPAEPALDPAPARP